MDQQEHYYKEKHAIDLLKANKFGLRVLIITLILSLLIFYLVWGNTALTKFKDLIAIDGLGSVMSGIVILFGVLIGGIVAHELIHGIFWALFAKRGFRSIKFGILKQYLTPYCHCKEPLKVKHYIIGALMPAVILGFIPTLLAIILGLPGWLLFGIFFISAAGGDLLMINLLQKEDKNAWTQDHASEPGYYMFRKKG